MSRRLRGCYALCIVTVVDTHTHRKVGTQSFRSKGLHWPTTAGLPARTHSRVDPDNCPLVPMRPPVRQHRSLLKPALPGYPKESASFVSSVSFNLTSR